jgi:very-short-patch-repair endonuclease
LRRNGLGVKFRRQHPIGNYVLDFYCCKSKLGIELDGGQHADPAEKERDRRRTRELERRGIRVLRVWNSEVIDNLDGVLERIFEEVRGRPPSP